MLLKAVLLKETTEKEKATSTPDATNLQLQQQDLNQFLLRCFNSLSQDREISGVQIASTLLQLPTHYTQNYNFVQVNLWWLRRYVRLAIEAPDPLSGSFSDSIDEEQCRLQPGDMASPVSRFDNYRWRGPYLARLTFFEYCMLVQNKVKNEAIASDIEFEDEHSKSESHMQ